MIVRKLRLQRGWSQDQLAELSGLNVRTIQRVERGHKPSLETSNSLASVFEVDLSTFTTEDKPMNDKVELKLDEKEAIEYAKGVKEFLEGAIVYAIIAVVFIAIWGFSNPVLNLVLLGVGVGLVFQGSFTFEVIRFPSMELEKRLAEKKLGRKL